MDKNEMYEIVQAVIEKIGSDQVIEEMFNFYDSNVLKDFVEDLQEYL